MLADGASLLAEAKDLVGRPVLQLSIVLSILTGMPMRCVREEDAAQRFVETLCDLAVWSEGAAAGAYFKRIAVGLVSEYLEEARVAMDRMRTVSYDVLVRQGTTLVDLQCQPGQKKGEIKCSAPPRQSDGATRGIQGGDLVTITPFAPGGLDAETIECEVGAVVGGMVILRSPESRECDLLLARGSRWRIDKMANKVAYVRQLRALRTVCGPKGNGSGEDTGRAQMPTMFPGKKSKRGDQRPDRGIIEALLEPRPPAGALSSRLVGICASPCISRTTMRALPTPQANSATMRNLNASQQTAIMNATSRRVTLVQGPPGTGKTHTSLKILEWWVRSMAHGQGPVLATSDSNIAVDNLLEGLVKIGIRTVRLGRPDKVRPELLQHCVDVPREGQLQVDYGQKMALLRQAQVVCSTCVGVGSDQLDGFNFPAVLLDEASQVTESSSLVPLCRACDQLVLVGDQCQLPPTVASRAALAVGAGEPLFNRLVAAGVRPLLLDTQYRMHPGISEFPTDLFYGGALKDGITADARTAPAGFRWPNEKIPVAFVPVRHGYEVSEGVSKTNQAEVDEVHRIVHGLVEAGLPASEIGVVSPYASQVRALKRTFRGSVEVNSVDGFQGREKECIVISTVRASPSGSVGFLADWRRVNVAFTRPRSALIVVGNPDTLYREQDTWRPWLRWVQANGLDAHDPTPRGSISREELRALCPSGTAAPTEEDGEEYNPHPGAAASASDARYGGGDAGGGSGGGPAGAIGAIGSRKRSRWDLDEGQATEARPAKREAASLEDRQLDILKQAEAEMLAARPGHRAVPGADEGATAVKQEPGAAAVEAAPAAVAPVKAEDSAAPAKAESGAAGGPAPSYQAPAAPPANGAYGAYTAQPQQQQGYGGYGGYGAQQQHEYYGQPYYGQQQGFSQHAHHGYSYPVRAPRPAPHGPHPAPHPCAPRRAARAAELRARPQQYAQYGYQQPPPAGAASAYPPAGAAPPADAPAPPAEVPPPDVAQPPPPSEDPPAWTEYATEAGDKYYHNHVRALPALPATRREPAPRKCTCCWRLSRRLTTCCCAEHW